jgi:AbrB family looped-hinge helix DNA binding protein
MGNRGRVVIPQEVRERHHLEEGTPMALIETEDELKLISRAELQRRVREDHKGLKLVEELMAERRAASKREDEESA